MTNILIAGCGYVGSRAGAMLVEAGHTVYGLKRTPGVFPGGIRSVTGDVAEIDARELPEKLDAVVIAVAASGFTEVAYRACYVTGVKNLLEQLAKKDPAPDRIVFTSSTGVYGQVSGEWVTEAAVTQPSSFSGKVMLEAEGQIHAMPGRTSCRRLGGIYGPERDRLVRQVRAGDVRVPGEVVYSNRIHREDAARAICHVLGLESVAPVYNVVDPNPSPIGEVLAWLSAQLNMPLPSGGEDNGFVRSRGGNKRVSSELLQRSGFTFLYPDFRSGYRELLNQGR